MAVAELVRRDAAGALATHEAVPELPLICSACLGDKTDIRIVRDTSGSECKLCSRVFTTYRWRLSGPLKTRMQTIICHACAESKHACQSCVLDIDHRIPLHVRELVQRIVAEEHGIDADVAPALAAVASEWPFRAKRAP